MILTKNKKKQIEGIDFNKPYPVIEAIKLLKEKPKIKTDPSTENKGGIFSGLFGKKK